jgi:hypothetical protein
MTRTIFFPSITFWPTFKKSIEEVCLRHNINYDSLASYISLQLNFSFYEFHMFLRHFWKSKEISMWKIPFINKQQQKIKLLRQFDPLLSFFIDLMIAIKKRKLEIFIRHKNSKNKIHQLIKSGLQKNRRRLLIVDVVEYQFDELIYWQTKLAIENLTSMPTHNGHFEIQHK